MGMFDWVDYECECPKCGDTVSGFQSKDGDCVLVTVKPQDVRRFYAYCKSCDLWLEFKVVIEKWHVERVSPLEW